MSTSLWPARAGRRRLYRKHLSCSGMGDLRDLVHPTPFGHDQKQRPVADAAEHTREAALVELDRLKHLAALADSYAPLVWNIRVPDRVFRIHRDAIRYPSLEVGPNPPIRKVAVRRNVEGGEPLAVGFGHDQC